MKTQDLISAICDYGPIVDSLIGALPTHKTKRFRTRDPGAIRGLCVHHSAGPTGDGAQRFVDVARYHVGPNHVSATGAPGVLYTLGIDAGGRVFILHDLQVAPWSQGTRERPGDENAEYLSCLLLGDFSSPGHSANEPTPEQLYALLAVFVACRALFGRSFELTGHYALGKPACPGSTAETLIRALGAHVEPRSSIAARSAQLDTLRDVQSALAALGFYPGKIDGLPGPRTRSAVASYQRSRGLTVDAVAGPATRERIAHDLGQLPSEPSER